MMTVSEVIKRLRTFPKDTPVTGYTGQEKTTFVTPASIQLRRADGLPWSALFNEDGTKYVGPYVDIMGF